MGREHKGLAIYAWVILDNHLHAILAAPDLSAVLRDLKSFTAKQLVQQIKLERREWLLHQLRHYRAAHKPNEYELWQEGSHPQRILHDEMMEQSRAERIADGAVGGGERHKQTEGGASARRVPPEGGINIAYLHHNPVKRGWVSEPEHWRYSSAHEWMPGAQPVLRCDPWRQRAAAKQSFGEKCVPKLELGHELKNSS